jgi:large subunit ribosomal protein L25
MADIFELQAQTREAHGKAAARRLRRLEDRVPAVVYGAGKAAQSISLEHNKVLHTFKNPAVFSHILKLKIDGQEEQVVVKDVLRHTHKPKILHVDFLRVKAKEKIIMQVPIHLVNEEDAPGIKAGGVLTKSMTEVEISCLPANLPASIDLDMSAVELDQTLHLSDLKLPKGVELTIAELDEEHNHPIVAVHVPKVSREDVEAEQHEAELAEEAATETEASTAEAEPAEEKAEDKTEESKPEDKKE